MKNTKTNKLQNRQFRVMNPLEIRTDVDTTSSDFFVEGYAMKWQPYPLYEDDKGIVYEEFRKGVFDGADMNDVIFLYDHQGKVFARTSNNTLKIELDNTGMFIQADLSKSQAAKEMYDEIKNGLVTKMSWSFKPSNYYFDEKTRTIVHEGIKKVYDVSAVGIPANNDTSINARDFANGVISEIEAERLLEKRKKEKLLLEIELVKEKKWN